MTLLSSWMLMKAADFSFIYVYKVIVMFLFK